VSVTIKPAPINPRRLLTGLLAARPPERCRGGQPPDLGFTANGSDAPDDPEPEDDLDASINGITEIVLDQAGNPYVAGTFSGTNFLGQEVETEGGQDILLARLDPENGNPSWIAAPGSANTADVMGMAIDAAANIYLHAVVLPRSLLHRLCKRRIEQQRAPCTLPNGTGKMNAARYGRSFSIRETCR